MPVCVKCGYDVEKNMKFCTNCGTPVTAKADKIKPQSANDEADGTSEIPQPLKPVTEKIYNVNQNADAIFNLPEKETVRVTETPPLEYQEPPHLPRKVAENQTQFNSAPQNVNLQRQYPRNTNQYAAETMSPWKYFLYFFFTALPIAGFIIYLVWLFGGSKYPERVNLARGLFIRFLIGILIIAVLSTSVYITAAIFGNIIFARVNLESNGYLIEHGIDSFSELLESGLLSDYLLYIIEQGIESLQK